MTMPLPPWLTESQRERWEKMARDLAAAYPSLTVEEAAQVIAQACCPRDWLTTELDRIRGSAG